MPDYYDAIIPDISVKISDFQYNVKSIAELLYQGYSEKNKSLPFRERIISRFPAIGKAMKDDMTDQEIDQMVEQILRLEYEENAALMDQRSWELQDLLQEFLAPVIRNMLNLFEVHWPAWQKEIICYLGLFIVFPRDVLNKEYWIHYMTPEEVVLKASVHEINHFILFEKWKAMHGYERKEEPDHPEPLWFLEEMAVDPTLNDPVMQEVSPFHQKAYQTFYDNLIEGIPIENHILRIYKERKDMADFLDNAYDFIVKYHNEITRTCG